MSGFYRFLSSLNRKGQDSWFVWLWRIGAETVHDNDIVLKVQERRIDD
jgi:hypothetical protein